ncbi:hypothetical protein [Klebsiella quasipneumoniae]|uniref:Morphogenetic protein n=1 Tax=Klebsiella quasipneumoniae TaxID=1463165 RepID=A0A2A5MGB6_9ENTR|nr:hypothetical protein [Klebsiella quasipneumoniae]PCM59938.1 hypothetical protein CP911_19075 [Klebsiella quasipneumoniae]
MTERGMIFNAEMVRALLDGRKTQTRRIMKVQPVLNGNFYEVFGSAWSKGMTSIPAVPGHSLSTRCPFGAVGDRIWVREGFFPAPLEMQSEPPRKTMWNIAYRDGMQMEKLAPAEYNPTIYNYERWTPSIHMPRWASRILLEITDVRVERLNAISEEDARAEGIIDGGCLNCGEPEPCGCANPEPDATDAFAYLWQSIYGQENWNTNPWVWVIEFKRVEGGAA